MSHHGYHNILQRHSVPSDALNSVVMDDLDHSVLIAEQDWENFYEESEECCIHQVRLAGLDDSGLSDIDDENKSSHEAPLPLQTNPDKSNEEHGAVAQRQSATDDHESGNLSKDSFCYEIGLEQTAHISLNDNTTTGECSTSHDLSCGGWQNNTSVTKNSKELEPSQGQVTNQPITVISPPCIQDTGRVAERESVTEVMESSATSRKEKERWFVTVNESPLQQKVYSDPAGQKKRRKKKSSRKVGKRSRATGGQCPHSKNENDVEEEKMNEGQKPLTKFKLPIQRSFSTSPDNACDGIISCSTNIQQVVLPAVQKLEEDCQKSSIPQTNCTSVAQSFSTEVKSRSSAFENNSNVDLPPESPENPSASLNSQSPSILTYRSELQNNALNNVKIQLANDQSTLRDMTIKSKTDINITAQSQSMTNNLSHVNNLQNASGFILRTSSTIVLLDELHQEQNNSILPYNKEIMSSHQQTENQEPPNENLETSVGPTHPIYALSSFWDEMERLTINDILHLRVANTRSPLTISVNPEQNNVHLQDSNALDSEESSQKYSSLVDADSTDSDYFTHLDDSKPDRSSCEFSSFSDFEEEFLQTINTSANPSPEPQDVKKQAVESNCTPGLLAEQLELTTMSNERESEDIMMLCCQDRRSLYLYPAAETQSIFLIQNQDSNTNSFQLDSIRKTPSPVLSVGNVLDDQHFLNLPEIFTKDGEELQTSTLDMCNSVVSFYSSKNLSVPETYDDFFSEFEVGNLLFPSVQDQIVPIFSSSRSVVRDLMFPDVEELIETDIEDDYSSIRVMTPFSNQIGNSPGTPNFYFFTNQRSNWRSFFSLRRFKFSMGRNWCQKVSAWIFPKEERKVTSHVSRAQSKPYPFHIENEALIQFAEEQKHAASVSNRESILFSLKQADMCLVCIAFASWVLKTSNSHSSDMWKTALLANVSAISAIQYLRQYVKKEGTEDDL